jgi:hypothetical protein
MRLIFSGSDEISVHPSETHSPLSRCAACHDAALIRRDHRNLGGGFLIGQDNDVNMLAKKSNIVGKARGFPLREHELGCHGEHQNKTSNGFH